MNNLTSHHSISTSDKGWTDQELGSAWLEQDFDPATAARNVSGRHCLLILDGHNSHCTYQFCKFAESRNLIVICLPSHTTHALQPCDVAVFGPLLSAWKSIVNRLSSMKTPINKFNFIQYYGEACKSALKEGTIQAAFRKTGIWPLDRNTIPDIAFAPALNMTTQAAQPLSTPLPSLLLELPIRSEGSVSMLLTEVNLNVPKDAAVGTSSSVTSMSSEQSRYLLVGLPPPLASTATRTEMQQQLADLHIIAKTALNQVPSSNLFELGYYNLERGVGV